jgi:hypothetical protein
LNAKLKVFGKATDVMFDITKAFEIILKFDACLSVHTTIVKRVVGNNA